MAIHHTTRALLTALLLSAPSLAQSAPAPNPPAAPCPAPNQTTDQTKPCPPAPDAKKPSTAEQFPFPGEPSKPAPPPSAPGATTPSSAAAEHPFPTTPPPKFPGDSSSSSSSSSSSGTSDDPNPADIGPPLKDEGTEGTSTHRRLPKVKRVQTDDERVDEDLSVAKFYMSDENLPGAYLRAKDAVTIQPDYSETHFILGQVAQKMKKKDEAIAEFKTYLKLDPEGEKAKAAQRALSDLQ
jgi:hypothetical protein